MTHTCRWLVEAEIKLLTPMHIGTGQIEKTGLQENDPWMAALQLDHRKLPCIPGATLKGALRALAQRLAMDQGWIDEIFGGSPDAPIVAGQAEFMYASCNAATGTTQQTRVAIDRITGSAVNKKLFSTQQIKPGTSFQIRIVVQQADDGSVARLLSLLLAVAQDEHFSLGSGAKQQYGQIELVRPPTAKHFGPQQAGGWLSHILKGGQQNWCAFAQQVDLAVAAIPRPKHHTIQLDLPLEFHTPFLVRRAGSKDVEESASNLVILSASSLRGRLRCQAERILRTLGKTTPQGHATPRYRKGSHWDDLSALLFGAAGWAGVVRTSEFVDLDSKINQDKSRKQVMVAIDRFTGGIRGKPFKVEYIESPTLYGSISINIDRMRGMRLTDGQPAIWPALGLMTLLLRDLAEGDIAFGYGVNKGYGQCTVASLPKWWHDKLKDVCPEVEGGVDFALAEFRRYMQAKQQETAPLRGDDNLDRLDLQPAKTGFHNPYHFIPLMKPKSDQWPTLEKIGQEGMGHDVYRQLSGRIVCKLNTRTPTFVGCPEGGGVAHFRLNDQLAIPATSLRGMISSLFESVSGSNLRVFGPGKYSMRKPTENALSAMGRVIDKEGNLFLLPLTLPTLKKNDNSEFMIKPKWRQLFSNYSHAPLRCYLYTLNGLSINSQIPYYMRINRDLQVDWQEQPKINGEQKGLRTPSKRNNYLIGQEPINVNNGKECIITEDQYHGLHEKQRKEYTRGWVRTLISQSRNLSIHVKHYVFLPDPADSLAPLIEIPKSVVNQFEELADLAMVSTNKDDEEYDLRILPYTPIGRQRLPVNGNKTRLQDGDLIFFDINDEGSIKEISFSSIWRQGIACEQGMLTAVDLLARFDSDLLPYGMAPRRCEGLSTAEQLFGMVSHTKKTAITSFAGKVCVGHGLAAMGGKLVQDEEIVLKELLKPKPPSPAFYFRRLKEEKDIRKTNLTKDRDYTIQGRKYYLHAYRDKHGKPVKLDGVGKANQQLGRFPWISKYEYVDDRGNKRRVKISPLRAGQDLYFEVDFQNLSQHELQQLCASLHPTPEFEHRVGIGKPLGLGSVKVSPVALLLIERPQRYSVDKPTASRYHRAWVAVGEQPSNWPAHMNCSLPTDLSLPSVISLANVAMRDLDPAVRRALELLGDPNQVAAPVHYPQLDGGNLEDKLFSWFVENDKHKEDSEPTKRQYLSPIRENSDKLQTLRR